MPFYWVEKIPYIPSLMSGFYQELSCILSDTLSAFVRPIAVSNVRSIWWFCDKPTEVYPVLSCLYDQINLLKFS